MVVAAPPAAVPAALGSCCCFYYCWISGLLGCSVLVGNILTTKTGLFPRNLTPLAIRKYLKEFYAPLSPLAYFFHYLVLGVGRDWGEQVDTGTQIKWSKVGLHLSYFLTHWHDLASICSLISLFQLPNCVLQSVAYTHIIIAVIMPCFFCSVPLFPKKSANLSYMQIMRASRHLDITPLVSPVLQYLEKK